MAKVTELLMAELSPISLLELKSISEEIQHQLDRRKPGQSAIVTQRKESDTVQFLSGTFEGKSYQVHQLVL